MSEKTKQELKATRDGKRATGDAIAVKVLLIDDDLRLAAMVRDYLGDNAFDVTVAHNGTDGLDFFNSRAFDLVVLDLMLPDIDGLEICRQMRTKKDVPILMLTAKGDPLDRIVGLELGADDYVPKPFEPRELLARMRAILRRGRKEADSQGHILRFGQLEIDNDALEAHINERRCDLTSYQFKLLQILAKGTGRVLTRDQIMNQLQGEAMEAYDRSIDVHISRLRSEIEDNPKQPRRILTVRGVGYVFAKVQE